MGFFTPCVIGPVWLKAPTPPGGSLRADFERVLALDFDHLIAGHGTPRIGGAKEALAKTSRGCADGPVRRRYTSSHPFQRNPRYPP